jgi:TolB-like protein
MNLDSEHANSITLAVFPFENLSSGKEADIFCKSSTLGLTTELSRFRQFQIISPNSIQNLPLPGSVDAKGFNSLETDYYIQGSFCSEQDRIRINAQLIASKTQALVWADRFEGSSEDLAIIQEGLLSEVVSSLQHKLDDDLISNSRQKQKVDFKA